MAGKLKFRIFADFTKTAEKIAIVTKVGCCQFKIWGSFQYFSERK